MWIQPTLKILLRRALLGLTALAVQGSSQPINQPVVELNVAMTTRDGVTLRADIYRPSTDGKYPVLLQRTPYNKVNAESFATTAVQRGYVVVVQDVRGRYASDGEWYPFKYEMNDGYDTIEWAAALPYSNGKVGMFGGSYVGATQMLAAVTRPPHLAGICPVVTASNYHENWTYQGGAFEQWFNESWTTGLARDTLDRKLSKETNAITGSNILPLSSYPLFNTNVNLGTAAATQDLAPYFFDWLAHPEFDSYWEQWAIDERYSSIAVPSLTVAAWYDIFQGGSIRNFEGMRDHAASESARKGQHMIVAIGGHSGWGRKVGEVDFGPTAEFNENDVTLDWYDFLFLGKKNSFATEKPVRLFVMGENKWRSEEDWPLKRAKVTNYFLQSRGKANSAAGDGSLATDSQGTTVSTPDTFNYDPANPVPTVGGPLCCANQNLAAGPLDQKKVEARPDVLVYSTPPLTADTEVTGPVRLTLYAKSSATDTDFTAKLVDVWPNGFAQNLTEGILRARYRVANRNSQPITPGKIERYEIDMWSTSNVFLKGHSIRLEVSSSNFPRFDRNLNTGQPDSSSSSFVSAISSVYHDQEHPSVLLLPVIPR